MLYQEKPTTRYEEPVKGERAVSRNGELFASISRSVELDLPMQLPRATYEEEAPLKIPSSRKNLDSSCSLIFDQEDHRRKTEDLGPIIIPEPPKLSHYANVVYKSYDFDQRHSAFAMRKEHILDSSPKAAP